MPRLEFGRRVFAFVVALVASAGLSPGRAVAANALCTAIQRPNHPVCLEVGSGAIFAQNKDDMTELKSLVETAATLHQTHFGASPPAFAVVVGGDHKAIAVSLAAQGVPRPLPWRSSAELAAAREASIRRAVEDKLKPLNLSPDKVEAAVQSALSQAGAGRPAKSLTQALGHELGHIWLVSAFWPSLQANSAESIHYGGPGADWLDETAAILHEEEAYTSARRVAFKNHYGANGSRPPFPLADFFAMEHPLKKATAELGKKAGDAGGASVRVVSGDEARALMGGDAAINFYNQCRVFADFLLETSGDKIVFASVARTHASGKTMHDWLAQHGAKLGVGSNVAELEKAWTAWVTRKYAGP